MMSNHASYIERIDEFPDGSARALVTLTAQGQGDTETWLPLDVNGDVAQQHADLAKRLHRLMKCRVRRFLNGLASACGWKNHASALAQAIIASKYDTSKLSFRALLATMGEVDLARLLETYAEEARVAGIVTAEEVERLLRYEPIDAVLEPRPLDVEPGPPLVVEEAY